MKYIRFTTALLLALNLPQSVASNTNRLIMRRDRETAMRAA